MYGNYISSCRLVAANSFGFLKVNEAPRTFSSRIRDCLERRCFCRVHLPRVFLTRGLSRLFPAVLLHTRASLRGSTTTTARLSAYDVIMQRVYSDSYCKNTLNITLLFYKSSLAQFNFQDQNCLCSMVL